MSIRSGEICRIEILTDVFEIIMMVIENLEKNYLFSFLGLLS